MTPRTLAEIVAEGERLEAALDVARRDYPNEPLLVGRCAVPFALFFRMHGPRLLAAVRAGMKMRKRFDNDEVAPDCTCGNCVAAAAWDAAAGGGE